jgi:neurofibromin 1
LSESVLDTHPDVLEESEKNYHTLSFEVAFPQLNQFVLGRDHFLLQEKHHQWRNLTLFLAAFGGACVHDDQDIMPLTSVIPSKYLPDEMCVTQESVTRVTLDSGALVESFVTDLTDLLVVDSMQVREVAREAWAQNSILAFTRGL